MDKVLGMDYQQGPKRGQFLQDNCDTREEVGYMKRFTPEEISAFKDNLATVAIEINDIEEAKKEVLKDFKPQLTPLIDEKVILLTNIKKKAEFINESCYKFIDFESKQVGYYNSEGLLVEERNMRPDEAQLTIRMESKTGTHN